MAHRPQSSGTRLPDLFLKLTTSAAILALATACTPLKQMSGAKAKPPALNITQRVRAPLKSNNPLHKATTYWATQYQQKPNDPNAALNYARNLKAIGAKDRAHVVLKRAHATHPTHPDIASEYGRAVLAKGQNRLALRVLKKAHKPNGKTDWRVLSAQGTAHAKLGDHQSAQREFIAALHKNPNASSVRNNLALSYAMSGNAPKAEGLLRQAIDHGSDTPKLRQNLALVLGLQRKFGEAQQLASVDLAEDKAKANVSMLRTMVRETPPTPATAEDKPVQLAAATMPQRKPAKKQPAKKAPAQPAKRQLTSKTLPLPWAKKAPVVTASITAPTSAKPIPMPVRKPTKAGTKSKPAAKRAPVAQPGAPTRSARAGQPASTVQAQPAKHKSTTLPWQNGLQSASWVTQVVEEAPAAPAPQKTAFQPFSNLN